MVATWKDVGLKHQVKQHQIPDAQWQLAIHHGFDHCQRQMMWRPVADFSGSRKSCNDCAKGNAGNGGIRKHNRYHYYDANGQRLPSAGPDPGLPAAPVVPSRAVPALPMVPPVMPSRAAAPFGVLGAVTNPTAVPAPVFGGGVSAPQPKAADVTAHEQHAHSEWNPKIVIETEKEVFVNPPLPTPPQSINPPTPATVNPPTPQQHHLLSERLAYKNSS
jgi:hypothetical protein